MTSPCTSPTATLTELAAPPPLVRRARAPAVGEVATLAATLEHLQPRRLFFAPIRCESPDTVVSFCGEV